MDLSIKKVSTSLQSFARALSAPLGSHMGKHGANHLQNDPVKRWLYELACVLTANMAIAYEILCMGGMDEKSDSILDGLYGLKEKMNGYSTNKQQQIYEFVGEIQGEIKNIIIYELPGGEETWLYLKEDHTKVEAGDTDCCIKMKFGFQDIVPKLESPLSLPLRAMPDSPNPIPEKLSGIPSPGSPFCGFGNTSVSGTPQNHVPTIAGYDGYDPSSPVTLSSSTQNSSRQSFSGNSSEQGSEKPVTDHNSRRHIVPLHFALKESDQSEDEKNAFSSNSFPQTVEPGSPTVIFDSPVTPSKQQQPAGTPESPSVFRSPPVKKSDQSEDEKNAIPQTVEPGSPPFIFDSPVTPSKQQQPAGTPESPSVFRSPPVKKSDQSEDEKNAIPQTVEPGSPPFIFDSPVTPSKQQQPAGTSESPSVFSSPTGTLSAPPPHRKINIRVIPFGLQPTEDHKVNLTTKKVLGIVASSTCSTFSDDEDSMEKQGSPNVPKSLYTTNTADSSPPVSRSNSLQPNKKKYSKENYLAGASSTKKTSNDNSARSPLTPLHTNQINRSPTALNTSLDKNNARVAGRGRDRPDNGLSKQAAKSSHQSTDKVAVRSSTHARYNLDNIDPLMPLDSNSVEIF